MHKPFVQVIESNETGEDRVALVAYGTDYWIDSLPATNENRAAMMREASLINAAAEKWRKMET